MKIELILHPVYVSGIGNNHCPVCAGIAVRNQQESVSGLRKNHCPEWSGISVRFTQEYANWHKGFVTGGIYHISVRDVNFLLQKVERNVGDSVDELISKGIKPSRKLILSLTYINEDNHLENERKINSGEIFVNEDGGAYASEDEFIQDIKESEDPKFDDLKKKIGVYDKKYILDYWDDFMGYVPDSYNSVKDSIEFYINRTEDNCRAANYSSEWLERFFKNIIEYGYSFKKDGSDPKPYSRYSA